MKRRTVAALLACCLLLVSCGAALAADKTEVRVSGQPTMHGMPTWWAMEEKVTANKPYDFKYILFSSGAPQVEAMAAGQWDVGTIGTIPTMMACLRYGALLIGMANNESELNDVWVRPDSPLLKHKGANPKYPEILGSAADWKGKKILATTVSNGHYVISATLAALGLNESDVKLVHMEQGQAMAAFGAGEGDILQLWTPLSYIAEAKGWVKVSSGRRAGIMVPSGICVVRKEFADKNPELVADWLETYMSYNEKMKSDPKLGAEWLYKFFVDYCGMELDKGLMPKEFELRPLYSINEQVDLLTDHDKAFKWMQSVAQFLLNQGRISQQEYDKYIAANCYIDPKFIKMVAERRAKKQ